MNETTGGQRVRVLLADDDAVVRVGVRAILAADPGIDVVAEAVDGREAVDLACRHRPDVILLDIRMPGTDGLTALPQLHATAPRSAVVMLTTFSEGDYVTRAVADGATGFLLKAGAPRELILGVRSVAEGGAFFSPRIAKWLIDHTGHQALARRAAARRRINGLTDRHAEVLALLGTGMSNAQIARALHLVEGTVKVYVSAILDHLNTRNRVQAAILAHEASLAHQQ